MADISIRASIQWKPDPPSEPTSTLVLTSPGKHFVDVRLLLPLDPTTALTPARLDWAFAGKSETTPLPSSSTEGEEGVRKVHSTWHHWVDSRTPTASEVVDAADMTIYPDGRAVETGSMVNPATGRETEYVEVWEEDSEGLGGGEVVVLRTEGKEGERGMVIRVGCWVQGILRMGRGGEEVQVGRWKREGKEWKVVARMGGGMDEVVGVVTGERKGRELRKGGRVDGDGRSWEVVEVEGLDG